MESNLGWTQKRAYLVQSLFQEIPSSSSIPEEDSPPPICLEPCSPLPPLNIEVIPKPNPHDEPEEFYEELEIKMKKLYRKLFYKDKTISDEDLNGLSCYIEGYDSDGYETDKIEMEKQQFDQIVKERAIVLEDLSNDNCNNQFIKRREKEIVSQAEKGESKEETVLQDERNQSKDRSGDTTDTSTEFRVITCVAEVHREDTDSESPILEQKSQSPILGYSLQSQVLATREEAIDINKDSSGAGENRRSTPEAINLETALDRDSMNIDEERSIDIMRTNNIRRHSVGSIRLTGHSSASSPLLVDFRHSRSLDLDLDLVQVSTLSNPTNLEATHDEAPSLLKDLNSIHNNSINQNDNNENAVKSQVSTEGHVQGFNRMTSTPKSKPTSAVRHDSRLVYGEDAGLSTEDKHEMDEEIDDKQKTETSKENGESKDDEYETYEAVTISNPDMDVEMISNDKVTATRDPNGNYKDAEDKSVSFVKTSHETERKDLGPATSTPKSRITITRSNLEEDNPLDELNTGRLSSSAIGTKRAQQELPQTSKKRKTDSSSQTADDITTWNKWKNDFFVGVPKIYKLCRCRHHQCDR